MKNNISLKIVHKIIMIVGTIFIFLSVFHSNIWFDEAYSVGIANQTFVDIWKIGGHDVHPVLYYWMLRIVNLLTNGYTNNIKIICGYSDIIGLTYLSAGAEVSCGILRWHSYKLNLRKGSLLKGSCHRR